MRLYLISGMGVPAGKLTHCTGTSACCAAGGNAAQGPAVQCFHRKPPGAPASLETCGHGWPLLGATGKQAPQAGIDLRGEAITDDRKGKPQPQTCIALATSAA